MDLIFASLKSSKNMNLVFFFSSLNKFKEVEFNFFVSFKILGNMIFFSSYKIPEKMNLISGKVKKLKNYFDLFTNFKTLKKAKLLTINFSKGNLR